jgi:hypothetical protein
VSKANKKDSSLVDFVEHNKAQTKALKKLLKSIEAQKDKKMKP